MNIEANCKTTAMGVLPHTDVNKALELVLSLDIPFWPQLPLLRFYEDMFAQVSVGFPGIVIDPEKRMVRFDTSRFHDELAEYAQRSENSEMFKLHCQHSVSFYRFLETKLDKYPAIRGQVAGPVNFGFRVLDEENKPIIYNEEVRALLFDCVQRKVNVQYCELVKKNDNAFIWLDEPGLGWVFTSFSGYNDMQAQSDYRNFFSNIKGPKALHLCLNVNLPYLLGLGLDILSINAYQLEVMPKGYTFAIVEFLKAGGIISWGMVPTCAVSLEYETPETLLSRLMNYWDVIVAHTDISLKQIAQKALLAPARCCIKSADIVRADGSVGKNDTQERHIFSLEEGIVEQSFVYVRRMSEILKDKFNF